MDSLARSRQISMVLVPTSLKSQWQRLRCRHRRVGGYFVVVVAVIALRTSPPLTGLEMPKKSRRCPPGSLALRCRKVSQKLHKQSRKSRKSLESVGRAFRTLPETFWCDFSGSLIFKPFLAYQCGRARGISVEGGPALSLSLLPLRLVRLPLIPP